MKPYDAGKFGSLGSSEPLKVKNQIKDEFPAWENIKEQTLNIILNNELYEPLAAEFQYEQVKLLKQVLNKFEITGDKAKEITGEFTFGLAMLIDQGEIEHEGEAYRPSITFTADEETHIAQPAEIEFHEYAFGTTADVFEQEP